MLNILAVVNTVEMLPSPSTLFFGLRQSYPVALISFGAVAIALLFLLWGHVARCTPEKRGMELEDEWVKTLIVGLMIFAANPLLGLAATASDAVLKEAGLGGPVQIAASMIRLASSMPELDDLLSLQKKNLDLKSEPQEQFPDNAAQAAQVAEKSWLERAWGNAYDFTKDVGQAVGKAVDLGLTFVTALGAVLTSLLKLGWMIICMLIMLLPLVAAGLLAWAMEQVRYFFLVMGATCLPPFVAAWGLPGSSIFSQPGRSYVMNMSSVALWPIAWLLGHTGTVVLFNAWLNMLSGFNLVPLATQAAIAIKQGDGTTVSNMVVNTSVMFTVGWAALPLYLMLVLILGALGLSIWIFSVTLLGPVWLHRMLTEGVSFYEQASGQVGATFSQTAAPTVNAALTAVGLPPVMPNLPNIIPPPSGGGQPPGPPPSDFDPPLPPPPPITLG